MRFTNYIENISSKRRKVVDDEQNIIKEDLKEDIKEDNNIDNYCYDNEEPKIGEIRLALLMESDIEYEDMVEKKYLWLLDGTEKELKNYLYYIIPTKFRLKCIISKARFIRINEYSIGIPED